MSIEIETGVLEFDLDTFNWVDRYRHTMREMKELQEVADIARSHIEAAMGDCQIGFHHNRPVVRWTTVTTERLNTKMVKEALTPELLAQFTTTSTSRRFTLVDEDE
jgi:predicted phage-related endonuclease